MIRGAEFQDHRHVDGACVAAAEQGLHRALCSRAYQLRGGQEQRVARGKKAEGAHSTGGAR